jgi:peptidylprolyl isomerase
MNTKSRRLLCAATLLAAALGAGAPGLAQKPKSSGPHNATNAPSIPLHGLDPLAPSVKEPPFTVAEGDWRTPNPDDLLVIDTNKGRIIVELYPQIAPKAVAQVKALARQHFYDGLRFFRVIDGFMAQTGDPKNTGEGGSSLPDLPGEFTFRRDHAMRFVPVASSSDSDGSVGGFIGSMPVQSQPDMIMAMTNDGKATAWPQFCAGVAAMARSASPDSANSQFFLMRDVYPALTKRYAGFGRVVSGEDVVKAIKAGEPVADPQDQMTRVRLASDLPAGEHLQVRVLDTASPSFQRLVERTKTDTVGEFSICDLKLPAEVH